MALVARSCPPMAHSFEMPQANDTLESVFRQESGRITATLIRLSGSFDLAEEALQEAFASAVECWQDGNIPEKPGAWLTTVAHRKLLGIVRRQKTRVQKQPELLYEATRLSPDNEIDWEQDPMTYPDDRLRLMFTCCHPALKQEAQVALTLRTLGG